MYVKWSLNSDYSKVKQYNVYVNDVYVGGKYDETFYIKKLPAKSGVIKVVAVGADGLEGEAATVSFDLNSAVSGIGTEVGADGKFVVKWTNPQPSSGSITVTVNSINQITTPQPVTAQKVLPEGSTSASFGQILG